MKTLTSKFFMLALIVGAAMIISASPARAEGDFELRGGFYSDAEEGMLGAGWLADVGNSGNWYFNPNVEYVFVNSADYWTLNADFHRDFRLNNDWNYWLGGGPALIHTDLPFADSDTDFGVNVLAGVGARTGKVRPFVQGKLTLADNSETSIGVGIRF